LRVPFAGIQVFNRFAFIVKRFRHTNCAATGEIPLVAYRIPLWVAGDPVGGHRGRIGAWEKKKWLMTVGEGLIALRTERRILCTKVCPRPFTRFCRRPIFGDYQSQHLMR
jgi:hypothetical protein